MRESVRVKLNPALLVWARRTAGLELPGVARTIGVTTERLASWEQGEGYPTVNQLEAFAKKVRRPLAALFLAAPPQEPPLPRDFRRLPGTELRKFSSEVLLAIRETRNTLRDAAELFREMDVSPALELPRASLRDNTAEVARSVRSRLAVSVDDQLGWRDDYAALRAWRDAMLDYGVLVLQFSFPNEEVRGFSIREQELAAVAVSSKDNPVARIFSMFHEFYHLCLGKPGVSGPGLEEPGLSLGPRLVIEQLCNAFAADFLVPLDDEVIRSALVDAAAALGRTDQLTRRLAGRLKVSKYVVLRRQMTAGFISREEYSRVEGEWSASDRHRKASGFSLPDRKSISKGGWRFSRLVVEALDSGRITEGDACSLLSVNPKWLGDVRERVLSGGPHE